MCVYCRACESVLLSCGCMQPTCTYNPALHLVTLHSRSILLHPATNMYVTSPSILSPLRCSVTTASASASDCLWWLTITEPPLLLVCPSCYKSLMIMCVFSSVCVCMYSLYYCKHALRMGSTTHIRGSFTKLDEKDLDEKTDFEEKKHTFSLHKTEAGQHLGHGKSSTEEDVFWCKSSKGILASFSSSFLVSFSLYSIHPECFTRCLSFTFYQPYGHLSCSHDQVIKGWPLV